jgi:hypothetical protein
MIRLAFAVRRLLLKEKSETGVCLVLVEGSFTILSLSWYLRTDARIVMQ